MDNWRGNDNNRDQEIIDCYPSCQQFTQSDLWFYVNKNDIELISSTLELLTPEQTMAAVTGRRGGMTLLHLACKKGNSIVIKKLVLAGAFLEAKSFETSGIGRTPLQEASCCGNLAACQELCFLGADPTARDENGATALIIAVRQQHVPVVECLLAMPLVREQINAQENNGSTALCVASKQLDAAMVAILVAHGADCNVGMCDDGMTCLLASIKGSCMHCCKALLSAGAKTAAAATCSALGTCTKLTPLEAAAHHASVDVVVLLEESGCVVSKELKATVLKIAAVKHGCLSEIYRCLSLLTVSPTHLELLVSHRHVYRC